MNTSSELANGPLRHIGAARISLFFVLWTGALLSVQQIRVEAAPIFNATNPASWQMAPSPPPVIETREFWQQISAHSEVMNGSWAPAPPSAPIVVETQKMEIIEHASPPDAVIVQAREIADIEPAVSADVGRRMARVERDPGVAEIQRNARAAIASGDDESAYILLHNAMNHADVDQAHFDLLAAVMVRTQRYREAVDVYVALIASDTTNPRLWAGYALALERIGRIEPSQHAYRNLLRTAVVGSALHEFAAAQLQRMG
ncbi:MAG: hypothetical protein HC809_09445 [Gammaproteobacteria bacterium]|nr:hypothetical protein [Gammaproteobacteria bacterium]